MKRILGLVAVCVAALALPSTASAWTPEDCAAVHWDHPDCVNIPRPMVEVCLNGTTQQVPADQVPEGAVQGECAVVPPPPPPVQPPVTVVPPPETTPVPPEQPSVDKPNVVDTPPQHDIGTPEQVKGKEEQKPNNGNGGQVGADVQPADTATLPYTGSGALWILLAGAVAVGAGFGLRRLAQR